MNFEVIEADQAQWFEVTSERGITLTVFKDTLDPVTKTGVRTRLVRFHPGAAPVKSIPMIITKKCI